MTRRKSTKVRKMWNRLMRDGDWLSRFLPHRPHRQARIAHFRRTLRTMRWLPIVPEERDES